MNRSKRPWSAAVLVLGAWLGGTVSACGTSGPRTPIRYDAADWLFRIDAGKITYAFGVNGDGGLQTLYWGARLAVNDPFAPAVHRPRVRCSIRSAPTPRRNMPAGVVRITIMPDLKLHFTDGNRDLVLRYDRYRIENGNPQVTLSDSQAKVEVTCPSGRPATPASSAVRPESRITLASPDT